MCEFCHGNLVIFLMSNTVDKVVPDTDPIQYDFETMLFLHSLNFIIYWIVQIFFFFLFIFFLFCLLFLTSYFFLLFSLRLVLFWNVLPSYFTFFKFSSPSLYVPLPNVSIPLLQSEMDRQIEIEFI
jgi:hypothetical protein